MIKFEIFDNGVELRPRICLHNLYGRNYIKVVSIFPKTILETHGFVGTYQERNSLFNKEVSLLNKMYLSCVIIYCKIKGR